MARSLISLPSVPRLGRGGGVNTDVSSMANAFRPPTRLDILLFGFVVGVVVADVVCAMDAGGVCCTICRLLTKPDDNCCCCCCLFCEYWGRPGGNVGIIILLLLLLLSYDALKQPYVVRINKAFLTDFIYKSVVLF